MRLHLDSKEDQDSDIFVAKRLHSLRTACPKVPWFVWTAITHHDLGGFPRHQIQDGKFKPAER